MRIGPRRRVVALTTFLAAVAFGAPSSPARAGGSIAEVDANARAAGNRRHAAYELGTDLFRTVWPAQLMKVRIDGAGAHAVAGLVLSGVKFHGSLDRRGFLAEVNALVNRAFAASSVEEVDCWATVPLTVAAHTIVAGDMAKPTSRIVFAVTVRRAGLAGFAGRLHTGTDVYWDATFAARLGGGPG